MLLHYQLTFIKSLDCSDVTEAAGAELPNKVSQRNFLESEHGIAIRVIKQLDVRL